MHDQAAITLTANGETYTVAHNTSLPTFLAGIGLSPDCVVVEHNRNALTPKELKQTTLAPNDELEIVRIVAGG